ncbi:SDR family oxidoreductase [Fodinibacter luteus]|uniref:SDR family oxidoreductase n=1 Tax=Fodinibacter luteus TaxID=552064 RepID=A0ABP8K320_9MICO
MSRVVVLGGTGAMGAAVSRVLAGRGHDVVVAARATGVDATTGAGLDEALAGADTVVDCLNVVSISRRTAVSFFGGAATRVASGAARAGVGHVVCLSVVNAADPGVRRAAGYYAGKAAQEEAYAAGAVPTTLARTTAWFSLAETFLEQIRVGPLAVVLGMRLQPVHPDAAAAFVADAVEAGPATSRGPQARQLAGPEELDAAAMARAVARARHPGVRVVRLPPPMPALRTGLLPRGDVEVDTRRFADWLAEG